jgi:hypothetical protein
MDWEPQDPDYVSAGMEDGYLCKYPTRCESLQYQLSAAEEEIKRYNWALSVVAELSLTLEDAKEVADVALGRR